MAAAEFEIFGHTFHGDEIRWSEDFDDQGVSLTTIVSMGDRPRHFVDFGASFEGSGLHYDVSGNFADCIDSFCEGQDAGGEFFFDVAQFF
jgi:hypothetical protein